MAIRIHIKKKLQHFDLQIDFESDEKRLGVLGASGCGKSMTLKCIAGIVEPDEGIIELDGKIVFDSKNKINIKPQKRKVGYLFQNYALFPNMTVEENVAAGAEKKENVKEILKKLQLSDLSKQHPAKLSGGQQQRVALARILASEPDIILLDEPFSALDSYLKEQMQLTLKTYLKDFKGIVCIVSHSRDEIYQLSSELFVMSHGHMIESGITKEVFHTPHYMQSARLTGCKNISKAVKIDAWHIYAEDWKLTLETAAQVSDKIAYVGIRAHDIIANPSEERTENIIPVYDGKVSDYPFEKQYYLRVWENAEVKECLIYKVSKVSIEDTADDKIPEKIQLPKEKLLLLL